METVKNTFVVETGKENQVRIGRSSILQPNVHFNGKGIYSAIGNLRIHTKLCIGK